MIDKPRLFIHVGTHKTGSTVIQNSFRKNAPALQQEGLVYIPTPQSFYPLKNSSEYDDDLIHQCRDELKTRTAGYIKSSKYRFFMSWEGFCGDVHNGYKNAPLIAKSLKQITASFDCFIIIYLRRQDDFIESLYTQMIHQGYSYEFEEYINSIDTAAFDWKKLLQCYEKHFEPENLCVKRYHKQYLPNKDSIINDFASITGVQSLSLVMSAKGDQNRGYSRDAVEIAKLTNRYLNSSEKKLLRTFLQETNSKRPFEKYSFWNSDRRKEILDLYSESNRKIAIDYFSEPEGLLFPIADTEEKDIAYSGLTFETFASTLADAIISMNVNRTEPVVTRSMKHVGYILRQWSRKFPKLETKLRFVRIKLANIFNRDRSG